MVGYGVGGPFLFIFFLPLPLPLLLFFFLSLSSLPFLFDFFDFLDFVSPLPFDFPPLLPSFPSFPYPGDRMIVVMDSLSRPVCCRFRPTLPLGFDLDFAAETTTDRTAK